MEFLDVMQDYFRGERLAGWSALIAGILLSALVVHAARTYAGGFMWGFVITLGLLALGGIGAGMWLVAKTPTQVAEIQTRYEADPAELAQAEQTRMAKVNANWPLLKGVWVALLILGLGLSFVGREWSAGVALGLLMIGACGMLVDVLAERRAHVYTEAINALLGVVK